MRGGEEHVHIKREREAIFTTSLSLKLIPAPAYSGEETGRVIVKLSSTTQIIDLLSHLSHNLPQETCGKLAPWPSHGSRDSSRTQACIYKAREGSHFYDFPLSQTTSGAGLLSHEYPPQYHRR